MSIDLIRPNWPVSANVQALVTTRDGGVSQGDFGTLNLGINTDDAWSSVEANRQRLAAAADLPKAPFWLRQVHGSNVVNLDSQTDSLPEADAAFTATPGRVCAVLTADCLPVFFCDRSGRQVAVAHAGWRGLAAGILEQTVATFTQAPKDIIAWLGPAISQTHFEVGAEVRAAFVDRDDDAASCFAANARDRWQADLYGLARQRLNALGLTDIFGGDFCTYAEAKRFFSYRRNPNCGRMASLIWIRP